MYCPQCGAQIPEGAKVCPNGHPVPGGVNVAKAAEMARKAASILAAPAPLEIEVRIVAVGLKILAGLTALLTLVGWWSTASFLAQLGVELGIELGVELGGVLFAGLVIGLTWSLVVYGFALIVQAAVRRGGEPR